MRKFFCLVLAVLCLTGCSLAPEALSDTTVPTNALIHIEIDSPPLEESLPVESNIPEYFELTEEHIRLTETNCPPYVGSYVRFPLGYLVDYNDPSKTDYTIVGDIDPDTEFKVIGVCYLDGLYSPSTRMENTPPITRADFERDPLYTEPEDPFNYEDFDYFDYLGAAIPIYRGYEDSYGMLYIQQNENSKIHCVPVGDGLGEFVP